jgi:hypothetical protein
VFTAIATLSLQTYDIYSVSKLNGLRVEVSDLSIEVSRKAEHFLLLRNFNKVDRVCAQRKNVKSAQHRGFAVNNVVVIGQFVLSILSIPIFRAPT